MGHLSVAWLLDIAQDVRFAARTALKDRSFFAVAVGTLAISIGLNATLFTIVSGMDNVPRVERPDRLVSVESLDGAGRPLGASYADFVDWRGAAASFDAMAATATAAMTLTDRDRPAERFAGAYVSSGTFAMLGEHPILGRDFRSEDDRAGAAPVAIIAAPVWKTRYGGDLAIVGRSIAVNGVATTIVGMMREGFRFPLVHDVWQPLASMPGIVSARRDARALRIAARLADGATIGAAAHEMEAIAARLAVAFPDTNASVRTAIEPYTGGFTLLNPWNAMLLAVSIVLLIACANIANLLISRAAYRAREMAIRTTLGATRWRLVRQLLVESLLLAGAGGAAGVFVAIAGVRAWLASMPQASWPYWYHFDVDGRVLAYIVEVAAAAALIFGIGPALYLSSREPAAQLTDRSHATSGAPVARRWSDALLAGQFALTLALLAGAGLLARTLMAVYRADGVVDTTHVLLSGVDLPPQRYETPAQRIAFYAALEARVAAVASVDAVAVASGAPFYTAPVWSVSIDGSRSSDPAAGPAASYVAIGSRYFETLGLRPLRGRVFSDRDGTPGFDTVIVNELFASRYCDGSDALGRRIRLADPNHPDASARWLTIVGVTPTVRQHYAEEIDAVVYVPYRLDPATGMVLLTRASRDPAALTAALREQLRQLDPDLPLVDVRTLSSLVDGTRFANKVFAALFGAAAVLGLLLAAIGLHAVTVYAVARRTREIGVRMALGARASQVIWLFVAQTLWPLAAGFAAGLGGAYGVGRFVSGMLIGTSPHDPATLAVISLTLVAVVLAAAFVPARRAARIDPAIALRVTRFVYPWQVLNNLPPARAAITFFMLAASLACRTTSATAPAATPPPPPSVSGPPAIIQPGAPGEASHVISAAAATDLSKVEYTGADIKFMQGMIGHHAQALEMIELLKTRTASDDMKKLALRIELSQDDEIKMMQHWLEARGQQAPNRMAMHMHGAMLMPGMLTADEMQRLQQAKGAEFDRLFLEGMIKHHGGALTMVKELLDTPGAAQESEVFAFVSDVEADQRMEIDRMGAMLGMIKERQQ